MSIENQDRLYFREMYLSYVPDAADILNCVGLEYGDLHPGNTYVGVFAKDCPVYGDSALAVVVVVPRFDDSPWTLTFIEPDSGDECVTLVNSYIAANRQEIVDIGNALAA